MEKGWEHGRFEVEQSLGVMETLGFNQALYNVASVGDLSLSCFGVTRRKDMDSDGQAANTEQACNKLLILIYY